MPVILQLAFYCFITMDFFHVSTYNSTSFVLRIVLYSVVWMCHVLFNHPPDDGHL